MSERILSEIVEIDLDRCDNTYSVLPCTASGAPGSECYNTFGTCQDKPNYARGVHTIKFTKRGSPIPAGQLVRPYVQDISRAPTEIDIEAGYAPRAKTSVRMADEPDSDVDEDPYVRNRLTPALGTFWTRLLARTPNYLNRNARISRVFVSGGVWGVARVEKYIIDRVVGPNRSGTVSLTFKDPTKRIDRTKIPTPTDGKLVADLLAVEHVGTAQGGSNTTVILAAAASPVDDFYNGMEAYVFENTGAGQRQVITDYVGASRTATVAGFAVAPDGTSAVEVGALQVQLNAGKGASYSDPVVTGKREFFAIGDEVIEYTAISADLLTWPSSTHRAAFGSTREDHKIDDTVQQCRVWISELFTDVIKDIHTDSGLLLADIDVAGFASEDLIWLGNDYRVTACIPEPQDGDELLTDLVPLANAVVWWDPIAQKVKFQVLLPGAISSRTWSDASELIDRTVNVDTLDDLRRTRFLVWFGLRDATSAADKFNHFALGEGAIDADAESENEYGDVRPEVVYSRWFTLANQVAMRAWVKRRLNLYRDAPKRVTVEVDPKDAAVMLAEIGVLTSSHLTDVHGAPRPTRMIVTRIEDKGTSLALRLRTVSLNRRYAFIAPDGTADHPTDPQYAHVSANTDLMGDGSEAYVII